jgi:Flp pilus assembly protein TadB
MIQAAQPATAGSAPGPALRDIHLPAEPSWWPPAPGWWLLALLLLLALLALAWWWRRRRRAAQQRQRVMDELDRLASRHAQDGDHAALAGGMHQLLRRVARRHVPGAAQQRGDAWRATLAVVPVDALTIDQLIALDAAVYRPSTAFDHATATTAMRRWLSLALKPRTWKSANTEQAHG